MDQGFTRAEHSYCLEYKAGGVGGVGGHEKRGAAESEAASTIFVCQDSPGQHATYI